MYIENLISKEVSDCMLHPKMRHVYVGIDIHRDTNTAVIIDCFFEKLGEITFENKQYAFHDFVSFVKSHSLKGTTPIFGLEDVNSLGRSLAKYLFSKRMRVKHVTSISSARERNRHPNPFKSDPHDALCVAKVLLSDYSDLVDVVPQDDYWTLSQILGRRRAVVKANSALKCQLRSYLMHHYPSYRDFFGSFDSKTALTFWERYPSPSKLKGVRQEDLSDLLYQSSNRRLSQKRAGEILALVKRDGKTNVKLQNNRDEMLKLSIQQLRRNQDLIKQLDLQIEHVSRQFDNKLKTIPGVNKIMSAELISQIGDVSRFSGPDKLAKYCGVCPFEESSGNTSKYKANPNGDRVLNSIFYHIVLTSIARTKKGEPINPQIYEYYQSKLKEGKSKGQAIKASMRKVVNIVYYMLKTNREYIISPKCIS